jgi:hypothetical protein
MGSTMPADTAPRRACIEIYACVLGVVFNAFALHL